MRRFVSLLMVLFLLCGCNGTGKSMDKALSLRTEFLESNGCSFVAEITADYFDHFQTFKLSCKCDITGKVTFEVLEPVSISGVSGYMDSKDGKLTFDDHVLLFSLLAEGRISPVSGPFILLQALRSGYIRGCSESDGALELHIDDTVGQDVFQLTVCTNEALEPVSADIFYQERRILAIRVEDFAFL